ncbi:Transcription repressor OFP4 [Sesamum alatum]|uniref:Transcription repressor n=1 Tax=Sesamum alatum TaxID=300844 RepID=A0AAE2CZ82_9LAMI|nr:Transcription repressor OFP4 [Sesamum alatum]
MKWGLKKSSPSQSRTGLIARVFPVSWFSKFNQRGGGLETKSANKQLRGKLDFPALNSSLHAGWRDGRFYSVDDDDDDAYWRLSFRGEGTESRRNAAGGVNPLWYDSDDEFQIPVSSFGEVEVLRRQEYRSFKDLDLKKMRENEYYEGNILRENGAFRRKKPNGEAQPRIPRKKHVSDPRLRKLNRRVLRRKEAELERGPDGGEEKSPKPVERVIFPVEPENMDQMKQEFQDSAVSSSRNQRYISLPNLGLSSLEEDYAFAALTGEGSTATSERASISEDKKCKEMKFKTESQRKYAYVRRGFHSRKIKQNRTKGFPPKTECRIGVLKDLKRASMKVKRKTAKVQVAEGPTIFDSFAVVKSSFNPQQDFRDSMVVMMRAKQIRRPEELQELLAAYLTLNRDRHHELIIKVFQEVWFELNRGVY